MVLNPLCLLPLSESTLLLLQVSSPARHSGWSTQEAAHLPGSQGVLNQTLLRPYSEILSEPLLVTGRQWRRAAALGAVSEFSTDVQTTWEKSRIEELRATILDLDVLGSNPDSPTHQLCDLSFLICQIGKQLPPIGILGRINEIIHVVSLAQSWTHSRHSINSE